MEKLLEQAQKLNKDLQEELSNAKKATAEANRSAADNRIFKGKLESLQVELDARENAVKNIEDILQRVDEAKRIETANKEQALALNQAKADFEKAKEDFRKEANATRSEIAKAKAENESERAGLRQTRDALKEKEATMRDRLIEELKKKL
jgi:hypothetical protein